MKAIPEVLVKQERLSTLLEEQCDLDIERLRLKHAFKRIDNPEPEFVQHYNEIMDELVESYNSNSAEVQQLFSEIEELFKNAK